MQYIGALVDAIVDVCWRLCPARAHPALRVLLSPLVAWRIKNLASILAELCKFLPPTTWGLVKKHGQNVVYGPLKKVNIFTKEDTDGVILVVDCQNYTVREVWNVPEKYRHGGVMF